MAHDTLKQWGCNECGVLTLEIELLRAVSPFDASETITACPKCKTIDNFYEVCDEPLCNKEVTCGYPAGPEFGWYRRTCSKHYRALP
jgi:hypothetical protein